MNKIIVYGIPNCDTIKKTLDWYKKKNITVEFVDYKKAGITKEKLAAWSKKVGYEILLNKKSTTWRSLSRETQQKITSEQAAIQLMQEYTSLIKRPVIEINGNILVGFNETNFSKQ
ncbi:MAG: glutathione-dependent thiol reductase [Ferruginibacter sp.]|uniref:Spx/MgsR family RNA polymerase-binding regulatory protein n=1 Tax=Ferruginibacter sp. TaxID=1940288 RepID=UPI00265A8874|nr:Spx/MgsR family RNA polymerase-binding regulatory protein [Ferruginibacter sp.]MDB5276894.1 glutathione-dependent thiol reductase [Ferruginibacter sp.]